MTSPHPHRLYSSLQRVRDLWLSIGCDRLEGNRAASCCANVPGINTCRCLSKQMGLTAFRMNTYEKPGGRVVIVNQPRKSKAGFATAIESAFPVLTPTPNGHPAPQTRACTGCWL